MAKNVNFGGFLTNPPNPLKFLPAKISSLKVDIAKLFEIGLNKLGYVVSYGLGPFLKRY